MAPLLSQIVEHAARSINATAEHGVLPEPQSLTNSSFTLDSSGVAGFFGGDTAVSGMATVNLFKYRRWGGWYNTPGAYEIAKQYGQLANSRLWDGLFPGGTHDPAQLFRLDGKPGPEFLAARSGSSLAHTGHLAYLLARHAARTRATRCAGSGRTTTPASVTLVDLPHVPPERVRPQLRSSTSGLLAAVPIAASAAACVVCALTSDWFCFASIALGIVASGTACFVLGSGQLMFRHHRPARGAPRGDGILKLAEGVVVLRGEEGAVNSVTRGRFFLRYQDPPPPPPPPPPRPAKEAPDAKDDDDGAIPLRAPEDEAPRVAQESQPRNALIGPAAILLALQFLLQLLLIPQGALLGQLLFVATLGVSWAYNAFLSSLDREDVQTALLVDDVLRLRARHVRRFEFGSWTAMAVFACLALRADDAHAAGVGAGAGAGAGPVRSPRKLLDSLIPNDTEVWEAWKATVVARLAAREPWVFGSADWARGELDAAQQELLRVLLEDAQVAYDVWAREIGLGSICASARADTPATAVDLA